jgi:hypothetical protein
VEEKAMKLQHWSFAKRLKIAAVCVGLLALNGVSSPVVAQNASVFKGIRIDMSGLPTGAVETRRDLQTCLARALPQAFSGRIDPSKSTVSILIVRPTGVWLGTSTSTSLNDEFSRNEGGGSMDSMEGEAIAGTRRVPLMVSASSDFGNSGAAEANARLRTNTLCSNFALWLARKI